MANIESELQTKKVRSKTHHGAPRRPDMVIKIINWYETGVSWAEIGRRTGMTRAGARHLYHKWVFWYQEAA